ncbi:chloride channel protein [Nocardia sp. NPDC051570]|uniref:chloride channel protein n=1 Tax=Nocardia sp. NPDC051570 TaxID=3364324 RepID=UPI0037A4175A
MSIVLVVQAASIGVVAALVAVTFRRLVAACTTAFTGRADYGAPGTVPGTGAHWPWLLLVAPVLAGAVYGPLTSWLSRTSGRRVRVATYRVEPGGGGALVKALAAVLCIGAGGSVGRTGPVVQVAAAAGAGMARLIGLRPDRTRLLVAAGAAGGLAASYNAPLAGTCFALEIVLCAVTAEAFTAVLPAALAAVAVSRVLLGSGRLLPVVDLPVPVAANYLLYAGAGLVAGAVGVVFSVVLQHIVGGCDALWRGRPEWARPIAGGLLLGAVLLVLPPLYGVGIPVITAGVDGRYGLGLLIVLMVGKMLATGITFGIGGYGGVFMPTLFVGAMCGDALGVLAYQLFPGVAGSPSHYAVIGMSAAFIGATRAPVTGVVLLLELTGDYGIAVPLLVAAVPALLVAVPRSAEVPYIGRILRRIPTPVP